MFHTLLKVVFGCAHQRTTFPLTPPRRVGGHASAPCATRHGTYVVCLDCGKEFDYDWDEMRVGAPVAARVRVRAAESFSPANR